LIACSTASWFFSCVCGIACACISWSISAEVSIELAPNNPETLKLLGEVMCRAPFG
jgi:hypothetical protein